MGPLFSRVSVFFCFSFLALALSACNSGDRSTRSPDLPGLTLNSITMNCPSPIAVGQTATCVAQCRYNQVNSDGSVTVTPPGACDGIDFSSDNPGIVTIDDNGNYTGQSPGTTPVNGCVDGGCTEVPITVVNPTLNTIDAQCTDTSLVVGQTTQCTAVCTYLFPNDPVPKTLDCMNLTWDTGNGAVVAINDNGDATGIGPGNTDVTATVPGGSDSVPITVEAVAASCSVVYPRGVVADPVPDADCEPTGDFATSAPVGTTVPFRAAVRLNNGSLCYAPDAPVNQQACAAGLVTFDSDDDPVATFPTPANGSASTLSAGDAVITATASVNQVTLTVTAPVLHSTFCVESVARGSVPTNGCQSIGAGVTPQCVVSVPNLATGTTHDFFAYAYFDVGTAQAQVCDVTHADNSPTAVNNWTIADVGSNVSANPSVNNVEPDKGEVSAGAQVTNGATVSAAYTNGGTTVNGSADFNVVATQVIANNSMVASATVVSNDPNSASFAEPTRAACVGSYDLVDGLAEAPGLPAEKRLFGVLRRCPSTALQQDGSCDPAQLSNTLEDVSNAETGNNLPNGTVTWTASKGYWDGSQCVEPADPSGLAELVGLVGDDEAPTGLAPAGRYVPGAAFTGTGDARVFTQSVDEDNGVAVSTGALSLGTACVTATYNEGMAESTDGITLIVLPVTNDSLLTDPDATEAVNLCNSLVPLFNLGASPDGANGVVIQVVAAVGSILNPALAGLDQGLSVTSLLATIVTSLTPITGPLSGVLLTPILEAANDGVYAPLNCVIGQVLNFINTQTPGNILACAP